MGRSSILGAHLLRTRRLSVYLQRSFKFIVWIPVVLFAQGGDALHIRDVVDFRSKDLRLDNLPVHFKNRLWRSHHLEIKGWVSIGVIEGVVSLVGMIHVESIVEELEMSNGVARDVLAHVSLSQNNLCLSVYLQVFPGLNLLSTVVT